MAVRQARYGSFLYDALALKVEPAGVLGIPLTDEDPENIAIEVGAEEVRADPNDDSNVQARMRRLIFLSDALLSSFALPKSSRM